MKHSPENPYISPVISQQDWSLHRKGPVDQARHDEKVKEAIAKNIGDIIAETPIISSDGQKIVKVPIKQLPEYKFRFDEHKMDKNGRVGQGSGNSKVGDVIGTVPRPGDKPGGAGQEPGIDYVETEITIAELVKLMFQDLKLPNLEKKGAGNITETTPVFNDIRRNGILANLDKRRTFLANLKRNIQEGRLPKIADISNDDLRFRTWNEILKPDTNAVVLAMMDVSGSMGNFEKYVARSFFFWQREFLRTIYNNVEIVFISHHTEAKIVPEEEFFSKGESGGTKISSAYKLASELIDKKYPFLEWNVYPIHMTDGDNYETDNKLCVEILKDKLLPASSMFGIGVIGQHASSGPFGVPTGNIRGALTSAFSTRPNFTAMDIRDKQGIYGALRHFNRGEKTTEGLKKVIN